MSYASVEEVAKGFRALSPQEESLCQALLEEAAVLIDAWGAGAAEDRKKLVSCRMVRRQLGDGEGGGPLFPTGTSQGSASALGYSQTFSLSGGSVGELYLSKLEKQLLGAGNKLGARSPLEEMTR